MSSKLYDKDGCLFNMDQWHNPHDGTGKPGVDGKTATKFINGRKITEKELNNIYTGDGLGARIINKASDDATSKWLKIENDTENIIVEAMNSLKAEKHFNQALKWSRLFGGGIIVMNVDDGTTDIEEPLDENKLVKVKSLKVYESTVAFVNSTVDYYDVPGEDKFLEPKIYTVIPRTSAGAFRQFRIHESRVLRFDGYIAPSLKIEYYNGWGVPLIELIYEQLKNTGDIHSNTVDIVKQYIINVMKIQGYIGMIQNNQKENLHNRLKMLDISMRTNNTIMIDQVEDLQRMSGSISGLADIIDRYIEVIAAVSDYPISILMGRPPKGLGSGGVNDLDLKMYHGSLEKIQKNVLLEPATRLAYLLQISKSGPTSGKIIKNWSVEFNPLQLKDDKEIVSNKKTQAEVDEKYIESGVLSNYEVRVSRFGGDSYSHDTKLIDGEEPKGDEDNDVEV